MKCNWCGKGSGNTYLKDIKMNKVFYYYCSDCIGNIEKELNPKLPEPIMDIKYIFPQKTKMDFSNEKPPEPYIGDFMVYQGKQWVSESFLTHKKNELIGEFIEFLGYYQLEWAPQLSEAMSKELFEEHEKWEERLL